MKKRESIGIVLLVVAIFFLLLSLAIDIYVEQVKEKVDDLNGNVRRIEGASISVEKFEGNNDGEG